MTREEMIRQLVLDRLEHTDDIRRYMRLQRVLENGFRGFRNMSDQELEMELAALSLVAREDGLSDDLDDTLGEHQFDSSLVAGHGFSWHTPD